MTEEIKFGDYLMNPSQVQTALNLLEENCHQLTFEELFFRFEKALGIQHNEGLPITAIWIEGSICRARMNTPSFEFATHTDQIGANPGNIAPGRANPTKISIFYGANNKKTAAFEVLQQEPPGIYDVTIGCWESENGVRVVNLIDGADPDFSKIKFAHSLPKEYLRDWPEAPKQSAVLLLDFFREKFKATYSPGLYNITNVIAGFCYSLRDIDGVGYAAVSDNFEGFNIALKQPAILKCKTVEVWRIEKVNMEFHRYHLLKQGNIDAEGNISW